MKKLTIFIFVVMMVFVETEACTSIIVSGKATTSGKPFMLKNRDTDELNNRLEYFYGDKFAFIGLVNSPSKGGEVWTGTNEVGFSIMNTASYNFRNDSLDVKMDGEGILMYEALGCCANLADFENFLNNHQKPLGVEANFGIIDAQGGAAYYEVNNFDWIKYDVNESPTGYRVVTNFCEHGRKEDIQGYERYLTASAIMNEKFSSNISEDFFFNQFSRSFRHEILKVNYNKHNAPEFIVDQDFIPRRITSAAIVIEGVKKGQDPREIIMWTCLGYPPITPVVPIIMANSDHIPAYMKKSDTTMNSAWCNHMFELKEYVFPNQISNGQRYLNLSALLKKSSSKTSKSLPLMPNCIQMEKQFYKQFMEIYNLYISGKISYSEYLDRYDTISKNWFADYMKLQ